VRLSRREDEVRGLDSDRQIPNRDRSRIFLLRRVAPLSLSPSEVNQIPKAFSGSIAPPVALIPLSQAFIAYALRVILLIHIIMDELLDYVFTELQSSNRLVSYRSNVIVVIYNVLSNFICVVPIYFWHSVASLLKSS
jgi:hypothetical protein